MGLYDRILVPVEGTEMDEPVLEHVARLAALCGAKVALHFYAWPITTPGTSAPANWKTRRPTSSALPAAFARPGWTCRRWSCPASRARWWWNRPRGWMRT